MGSVPLVKHTYFLLISSSGTVNRMSDMTRTTSNRLCPTRTSAARHLEPMQPLPSRGRSPHGVLQLPGHRLRKSVAHFRVNVPMAP